MLQFARIGMALVFLWLCCQSAIAEEDLYSRDWSAEAETSWVTNPPSAKEVEEFLYRLLNEQPFYRDSPYDIEGQGKFLSLKEGFRICGYKFLTVPASLYEQHSKSIYVLVVLIGSKSATSCGELLTVAQEHGKFRISTLGSGMFVDWPNANVDRIVRKVEDSATPVLVMDEILYQGHHYKDDCIATLPVIYKYWAGPQFARDDAGFHAFYREQLQKLETDSSKEVEAPCRQMEQDKIARLLGTPDTGYARAVEWAKSKEPKLRLKAVQVFHDIGDTKSKDQIAALKGDPDPGVATLVDTYLNPIEQTY